MKNIFLLLLITLNISAWPCDGKLLPVGFVIITFPVSLPILGVIHRVKYINGQNLAFETPGNPHYTSALSSASIQRLIG